ncbi:MAG: serine/threonine protein kinase, partial [Myxococcales bacterium]|nr:serine/threonine protein kinase [Myxococcales bacterium]
MSREPDGGDPRASPRDIEAARLRARMREAVFKRPAEKVRIDRFEIVRRLGAGAMGLVYEVTDPRTGGHLALKTVRTHNPRALALFKREFRSLARVTHPNLVSLYELGRDDNTFFFTMELIRGVTLLRYLWGSDEPPPGRDQLPASPILDFDRLRGVLSQLAAGVAALHDAGKLHRDIKPTNVMVTADGRVVLMDFGFVTDQLGSMLESTQGSLVVGTPAFMPPEQSRAERLGAAADWYSVGATLYLALTGQPPYSGLSAAEILLSKETEPPAHPRLLARG